MKQYSDNLKEITLKQFKECLDGNYKVLHNEGDYSEDDCKMAWFNIYDEYNGKIKTQGNNIAFHIQKKLYTLPIKKWTIETCLYVITELITMNYINLSDVHEYDEFIAIIENYGFKFDKENPIESINKIKQQVKNFDTQIKREQKTLEEINKRGSDWTFNKTVLAVNRFMGYEAMHDKTNMIDFVDGLNMMLTPVEDGKHTNR